VSNFDEVRNLTNKVFGSSEGNSVDFSNLLQKLFSLTVLKEGEAIVCELDRKMSMGTLGSRLAQPALQLNNGLYLKFFMKFSYGAGSPLTITSSSFQYQVDGSSSFTRRFVFRYDYDINPQDGHLVAHLQINGKLNEDVVEKKLEDIRFPIVRPSVESLIILLIDGFGLRPNDQTGEWRKILDYSESAFREYQAKKLIYSQS
jgi:hypothetical protein